jgi:Flp pilus assembly protein TadD
MTNSRGGISTEEATDLEAAEALIESKDWASARPILQRLAAANRAEPKYRALLAFVLGHEAAKAGDLTRARADWERAKKLDPSLEQKIPQGRRRPRSFVQRLFGR